MILVHNWYNAPYDSRSVIIYENIFTYADTHINNVTCNINNEKSQFDIAIFKSIKAY